MLESKQLLIATDRQAVNKLAAAEPELEDVNQIMSFLSTEEISVQF